MGGLFAGQNGFNRLIAPDFQMSSFGKKDDKLNKAAAALKKENISVLLATNSCIKQYVHRHVSETTGRN